LRRIDSGALEAVQRFLGFSGVGASQTELIDEEVNQSLEIGAAVRRARADVATGGLFYGILRNEHPNASTLVSFVDPYAAQNEVVGTYPAFVPRDFDVWVEAVGVTQPGGTAPNLLDAAASLQYAGRNQGWGKADDGSAIVESEPIGLAMWTSALRFTGGTFATTFGVNGDSGEMTTVWRKLGFRMPRADCFLHFNSTSNGAGDIDCIWMLGLFPTAYGSDAAH